jgi:hypothetical protein
MLRGNDTPGAAYPSPSRAFVTQRDPMRTGMALHSVTKLGLNWRALRKSDKTSRVLFQHQQIWKPT